MFSNWPKFKKYRLLILLLVLAVITRFSKLNWGNNLTFHPDENNMASAVSALSWTDLNPNFFAYGQFPLYLAFITIQFLKLFNFNLVIDNFLLSVLILRFWSALFSFFSVILVYLIGIQFLNRLQTFLFTIFFTFLPGLIQLSHFGTTESLLICCFLAQIYLAQIYLKNQNTKTIFLSAIISGLAISSKITALFFILPILISILIKTTSIKKLPKYIFHLTFFLFLTSLIFLTTSPFNLLNFPDFISSIQYETSVATGKLPVFYTSQFIGTTPFLFQIKSIFPYISGIPLFIFSIFGLVFFFKKYPKFKITQKQQLAVILIPSLIYLIYSSQLYVKWTRFMSPIFFLIPLFATYFISQIKNQKIQIILSTISLLPGLLFFTMYLRPDIRLSASAWVNQNLPANSVIFSEAGNVINFPYKNQNFQITNFDFYNLDTDPDLISQLPLLISNSDYIIVPSRRIFKNQNNSRFPYSQKYYQSLFSGQLGFQPLKIFTPSSDFLLNGENAEETWTVFDHPTIRIYQNINHFSSDQIQNILLPPDDKT
ncbi:hypothetical protein A2410_02895 [Candidatus Shapirobacteria bacterium RIFOXYC1_FULL_38_24]|uniref:Glycosyltransferase RgtA/B/C/D-like domain-containing protein n=3 Tax=Candidatus Shapironibacteriota TaxID=1752721 RepID=A0A0G0JS77_9BACT|nr:MAG: hypothetical protein US90_C0015G0010 [Candidatus Shapirobacteria bacterium GW2011_GWE2_38_30]OGL56155.1 MAG: hypothetical protein A2410_02895 [Candidatus Shapirobacteria bacterium RIFOXYC1_FULL_38_24]OGL57413.1 MAG: hypothetical protein A2367_02360 [Candidatus Shapirobacteria bacterium RIFOXYB1_FULL_38_38]HAP37644.1 hypothetical protein [Candidatus Shapirobacteria bacterium]HCU55534.1 hypothetical protein [Candidatus Shapirobacteria bacterium]